MAATAPFVELALESLALMAERRHGPSALSDQQDSAEDNSEARRRLRSGGQYLHRRLLALGYNAAARAPLPRSALHLPNHLCLHESASFHDDATRIPTGFGRRDETPNGRSRGSPPFAAGRRVRASRLWCSFVL